MDLYIVLGVAQGASEADIKRAYRRLARRFHPDINPGDRMAEARFRQILDAYETLIDPQRRLRYDQGQGFESGTEPTTSGFEGFDFSARGVDHSATFGDLFAEVLSQRRGSTRTQERGADLHPLKRVDAYYVRGARSFDLLFHPAFRWYLHARNIPRRLRRAVGA